MPHRWPGSSSSNRASRHVSYERRPADARVRRNRVPRLGEAARSTHGGGRPHGRPLALPWRCTSALGRRSNRRRRARPGAGGVVRGARGHGRPHSAAAIGEHDALAGGGRDPCALDVERIRRAVLRNGAPVPVPDRRRAVVGSVRGAVRVVAAARALRRRHARGGPSPRRRARLLGVLPQRGRGDERSPTPAAGRLAEWRSRRRGCQGERVRAPDGSLAGRDARGGGRWVARRGSGATRARVPRPRTCAVDRSATRADARTRPVRSKLPRRCASGGRRRVMERRSLGATGLSVTPIGLGLAALGRPAYIDLGRADDLGEPDDRSIEAMRTRAHAVLDAAFELGVRYFDAARSYGLAEEFLGSLHEVKDHTVGTLRRQIEESRGWLGDRLALYQIHSATLESAVLDDAVVLDELTRLHEEHGLVIGITTSGPRQAETIRRALEVGGSGAAPFVAVQATWNVLETSAGPALADAHDAGWGILVKEVMANGRLGPRGTGSHRRVVDAVAERHGIGPDAVALGAVLAQPWADVVLSGAVNEAQLRSNLEALDVDLTDAISRSSARSPSHRTCTGS